jgi:hypothetical protein
LHAKQNSFKVRPVWVAFNLLMTIVIRLFRGTLLAVLPG